MNKKVSVSLAFILVISLLFSAFSFASAADLKDTRYRFPIMKFEMPNFTTGKAIDTLSTKSQLRSKAHLNGPDKLYFATIERYPRLDYPQGVNKALRILSPNKDLLAVGDFTGFEFSLSSKTGSNRAPLKGMDGIPQNSKDHGIMIHVEVENTTGKPEEGFQWVENKPEKPSDNYIANNAELDFNITFQEIDFNDDGTKRINPKKPDEYAPVAFCVARGAEITYIWTKSIDLKQVSVNRKDLDGNYVLDDKKNGIIDKIDMKYNVGDVMTMQGRGKTGGTIPLPPSFCGYILIPFSSLCIADSWGTGVNENGKIDLKDVELCNIYTACYPQYRGARIFDDYYFYGPTFAKVNGAYDMSDKISNTNFKIKPTVIEIAGAPSASDPPESSGKAPDGSSPSDGSSQVTSGESSTGEVTESGSNSINSDMNSIIGSSGSNMPVTTPGKPFNPLIIWIIVIVAVLVIAGGVVFFIIKNKKNIENLNDFDDENNDNSSPEEQTDPDNDDNNQN